MIKEARPPRHGLARASPSPRALRSAKYFGSIKKCGRLVAEGARPAGCALLALPPCCCAVLRCAAPGPTRTPCPARRAGQRGPRAADLAGPAGGFAASGQRGKVITRPRARPGARPSWGGAQPGPARPSPGCGGRRCQTGGAARAPSESPKAAGRTLRAAGLSPYPALSRSHVPDQGPTGPRLVVTTSMLTDHPMSRLC